MPLSSQSGVQCKPSTDLIMDVDFSRKETSHKECPLLATGSTSTRAVAVELAGVNILELSRVNSLDLAGVNSLVNRRGNHKTTEQLKAT